MNDDLAHAILRDAMVMAIPWVRRGPTYWSFASEGTLGLDHRDRKSFLDSDHGNCPTRSLFAAFCAVFPEINP